MDLEKKSSFNSLKNLLDKSTLSPSTSSDTLNTVLDLIKEVAKEYESELPILIRGKKSTILIAREEPQPESEKGKLHALVNPKLDITSRNPLCNYLQFGKSSSKKPTLQPTSSRGFVYLENEKEILSLLKGQTTSPSRPAEEPSR